MAMMNALEGASSKAQEVRDHVAGQDAGFSSAQDQIRPGVTTSGKPKNPNGNWDGKASHILQTYKENLDIQSFLAPQVFLQGALNQKKEDSIHFNASTETVSMFLKLLDSVNHLCILLAVMKYMDNLRESPSSKHRTVAQFLKSSPRGNLLLEQREKRGGHVHQSFSKQGMDILNIHDENIAKIACYQSPFASGQDMITEASLDEIGDTVTHTQWRLHELQGSAGRDAYIYRLRPIPSIPSKRTFEFESLYGLDLDP